MCCTCSTGVARGNGYSESYSDSCITLRGFHLHHCPLTERILQQRNLLSPEAKMSQAKANTKIVSGDREILQKAVDTIWSQLPLHSQEKDASTWLIALPIQDHGFTLYKSAFWDALCLKYGWEPKDLASHCIRMWKAIQCGACLELPNRWLPHSQAQWANHHWWSQGRVGFWGNWKQRTFLDVIVFNPFAKSYWDTYWPNAARRMSKGTTTMYKRFASLL